MSILTKNQTKQFVKTFGNEVIKAMVRFDDRCGNGHNTFSITGELGRLGKQPDTCGCIHEEISKHFPELVPYIKYHLVSTDGPMHYIANTLFHVQEGNLQYARSSAVWLEATDDELHAPDLKERLLARLPGLMEEFKVAVEALGFVY